MFRCVRGDSQSRGAPLPGHTPRFHARLDREPGQLLVEEDCVDRKANECRVNRPGGPEEHALAGVEPAPTDQAADPWQNPIGEVAALAHDLALRAHEDDLGQTWPEAFPERRCSSSCRRKSAS